MGKVIDTLDDLFSVLSDEGYNLYQFKDDIFFRLYHLALLAESIPVKPCKSGACTDGSTIYIQGCVNEFPEIEALPVQNRNHTVYKAFFVHETAHILEGSFDVNLENIIKEYDNRDLAFHLFNIIEDRRIEWNFEDSVAGGQQLTQDCTFLHEHYALVTPYKGERFYDFMECWLRTLSCGRVKGEVMSELGQPEDLFERYYTKKGLQSIRSYKDLRAYESNFLSQPLKTAQGTHQDLLNYLTKTVHALRGKTVVDTFIALKPIYSFIQKEFETTSDLPQKIPDGISGTDNSEDVNIDESKIGELIVESTSDAVERRDEIEEAIRKKARELSKDYGKSVKKEPDSDQDKMFIYDPANMKSL